MSGHSKWANIKRKKGANDAIRGKITTKIGREITIAVRMGGADPTGNMRLKLALSKAKSNNIPKDNIKRAIEKGLGNTEGGNYEEIMYEGYGPGGTAVMLDILTDNRNRTAADVRHLFSKFGGNLGQDGCVAWMFKKKAVFIVEKEAFDDEDALMEIVLEAGAEDMKSEDEVFEITGEPESFDPSSRLSARRASRWLRLKLRWCLTRWSIWPAKMLRRCRISSMPWKRMTTFRTFTAITSPTTKSDR